MILRNISAANFKGATFSHGLTAATAIVGDNWAGKSAIVQAIRLALGGYLPECGKTPKATWELSSGPEMIITAGFDGFSIFRRYWLERDTVKAEAINTGPGAASVQEFRDLPLLDDRYFQMTDDARVEYVFSRIQLPDFYTPEAIIAECQRLSFGDEHTESIERAKMDHLDLVRTGFKDVSVQEGLAGMLAELRERFTYWNRRAKDTQGAVKTLAELKLREEGVVAAAQSVAPLIAKAQEELEYLNVEKGKLEGQQAEWERTEQRKRAIQAILDADRIDFPRTLAKIDDQIKEAEGKRVTVEPVSPADLAAIRNERQPLGDAFGQRGIEISRWMGALEELDDLEACPYCKSSQEGWQANLRRELNMKLEPAKEEQEKARGRLESLDAKLAEMTEQLSKFEKATRVNAGVDSDLSHFRQKREILVEQSEREERERTRLTMELAELNKLPKVVEQLDIGRQISARRKELREAQEKKDAELMLRVQLRSAAQAELEHQEAAAHVRVVKALAAKLKGKREAMIEDAFASLLDVANLVTRGILKTDICLHEGTIGYWNEGKFVPHRVFSGMEKALTYIAVAVALSSTAPLKLAILDEFGRLSERNQGRVLNRLSDLVFQKVIDQYIVVGTSLPVTIAATEGVDFTVINV